MNRKEWQAIERARDLHGLGEAAMLAEIKRAYHRQSKLHHPDTAGHGADSERMVHITAAYELLMRYTGEYRFPLSPQESDGEDDRCGREEWWQAGFGQEPLWSGRRARKRGGRFAAGP